MDERYHNNDDDILHKSINMIWKLLDSQNKGVIDEQYYIYQLKMLDKIMNYNTNNKNGYSSKGNNNNSDELHPSLFSNHLFSFSKIDINVSKYGMTFFDSIFLAKLSQLL